MQPLGQILDTLRATYCGKIGVEFTHIQDPVRKVWLQRHVEEMRNHTSLDGDERARVLEMLSAAELFERFLHTRFVGRSVSASKARSR